MLNFLKSNKSKDNLDLPKISLGKKIKRLFSKKINTSLLDEFESLLYEADLGVDVCEELSAKLTSLYENGSELNSEIILAELKNELLKRLTPLDSSLHLNKKGPTVILIVGVNGSGKTTSIAKLARYFKQEKKKVLLTAADPFRAAAIDQLALWSERLEIDIVKGMPKSDPSAVVFDALAAAESRQADICLIDTAGRLQSKIPLMQELQKMRKVCERKIPGAPHETLMVIDASTGQNAIDQAKTFHQYTPLSGLILSKLDGSAKGGTVIALQNKLQTPVKFIGLGESIEDFEQFNPERFISALLQS